MQNKLLNAVLIILVSITLVLTFYNRERYADEPEDESLSSTRLDISYFDDAVVTLDELVRLEEHCLTASCGILIQKVDRLNLFNFGVNIHEFAVGDLDVVNGTNLRKEFRGSGAFKTTLLFGEDGALVGVKANEI